MRIYARIQDGVVAEIINTELDIDTQFHPDFVATLVEITDANPIPGEWWTYAAGVFAQPVPRLPTAEEQANTRDALMREAALRIGPLQDAVDLAEATAAEEASLLAWKQYRVALNRLDLTAATVTWPAAPA